MRFYTKQHKYYCGIDLHARVMYLCILNADGETVLHRNVAARPGPFLKAIAPYRDDLVVGAECMFTWYWLADLCEDEGIPFVLGYALYMKAIHGGKVKNDRVDSLKIAALLRGGMFPMAYVYPRHMRPTRDLLRRRLHFVHKRAELLSHIQNTNSQYNLPPFTKLIAYRANREGLAERFADAAVAKSIELDLALIDHYHELLTDLELTIMRTAKQHDGNAIHLLRSIPGIGKVLSMTILYEICTIERFARVQDFLSYARLVKPPRSSAGKLYGHSGAKIGNAHLKWAFSEAATLFIRHCEPGKKFFARLERKHSKGKALSVLAHKLARAAYFMLRRNEVFNVAKFTA
jgi:transposase